MMRSRADWIDDPRAITVAVAACFATALWVATWSVMGRMDMSGMAMGNMAGMATATHDMTEMGTAPGWSLQTVWQTSLMWLLMMAAMMLPAMTPIMALYTGIAAKEDSGVHLALRVAIFTGSYFVFWAVVSITLALAQLGMRGSDWFVMGGTKATPIAAGILMLAAGLYQFTTIKHVCLTRCRHPLSFLLQHWRDGLAGAFQLGSRHGLYCVGCCVAFMGLMFVFGAMNIWWMAAIALYFLAEKIIPHAERWSRIAGALLVVGGLATLSFQTF